MEKGCVRKDFESEKCILVDECDRSGLSRKGDTFFSWILGLSNFDFCVDFVKKCKS